MTAYRERGTDRLHLVDAEPAEVGIIVRCGPKRTPENCTRTRRGDWITFDPQTGAYEVWPDGSFRIEFERAPQAHQRRSDDRKMDAMLSVCRAVRG